MIYNKNKSTLKKKLKVKNFLKKNKIWNPKQFLLNNLAKVVVNNQIGF